LLSLLSSPRLPFSKSLAFEELWSLAKIVAYRDCHRWLLQAAAFHDLHKKQVETLNSNEELTAQGIILKEPKIICYALEQSGKQLKTR
jgi:hypothetical protein